MSHSTTHRAPFGKARPWQAVQRIGGVGLEPIKEVFAVEKRLAPARPDGAKRGADVLDVLGKRRCRAPWSRETHGSCPPDRRPGCPHSEHFRQHIVIGRRPARPLGHAKGGESRAGLGGLPGERTRCRWGSRRASRLRCSQGRGVEGYRRSAACPRWSKTRPLRLLPVAQGGVEEGEVVLTGLKAVMRPAFAPRRGAIQPRQPDHFDKARSTCVAADRKPLAGGSSGLACAPGRGMHRSVFYGLGRLQGCREPIGKSAILIKRRFLRG